MTCDHDATKASFDAFFGATDLIGAMPDGDGGWLLLGLCRGCKSTLAKPIAEPRGCVARGTLKVDARALDEPPPVRSRYGFDNNEGG